MADMTIKEALTKIEGIGNFFCSRCIKQKCKECSIQEAYKMVHDCVKKLEAYDNADLIKIDDAIHCVNFTGRWLLPRKERKVLERAETLIREIPRFELKGSDE